MRPDYSPVMNVGICKCIEEYFTLAPNPPLLAAIPSSRQWVNTTRRNIAGPCEIVQKVKLGHGYDLIYAWSENDKEASQWSVVVVRADDISEPRLTSFHVTFPLLWGQQTDFVEMIRRWSGDLGAYHGTVGFGLLTAPDLNAESKMDTVVYKMALQYPGINGEYPPLPTPPFIDGHKTVYLLTLVGAQLTAKVGGEAALREQLGEDFHFFPFGQGGVLIQAGVVPSLGLDGATPALYVQLNKALKPIRIKHYPDSFQRGQFTTPFFDEEASQAWIERFD